jgi:hypothetical protein
VDLTEEIQKVAVEEEIIADETDDDYYCMEE